MALPPHRLATITRKKCWKGGGAIKRTVVWSGGPKPTVLVLYRGGKYDGQQVYPEKGDG
ncbi:hypothetical protein F8568_042590 [Actinomadura sp. LD22]|uniref:Uncharacterized protein n=1 Tax=Actinomadura physcomitrii TaxID=2650748 RepID=A0A6I4MPK1_9ACTN|nr:hypothetical protein [Actinomadura physcomitrii]MWA06920.1 hypothetical protein [Actinomadura physcomitrii]